MTTFQVPQTHARQLVQSYALCDILNIPSKDIHRVALWLDRNGITQAVLDEFLSKDVVVDMDNLLIKLLELAMPHVKSIREKSYVSRISIVSIMVRDRVKEDVQPVEID